MRVTLAIICTAVTRFKHSNAVLDEVRQNISRIRQNCRSWQCRVFVGFRPLCARSALTLGAFRCIHRSPMGKKKRARQELLPGTLDMLILKTLSRDVMHGYGIAEQSARCRTTCSTSKRDRSIRRCSACNSRG